MWWEAARSDVGTSKTYVRAVASHERSPVGCEGPSGSALTRNSASCAYFSTVRTSGFDGRTAIARKERVRTSSSHSTSPQASNSTVSWPAVPSRSARNSSNADVRSTAVASRASTRRARERTAVCTSSGSVSTAAETRPSTIEFVCSAVTIATDDEPSLRSNPRSGVRRNHPKGTNVPCPGIDSAVACASLSVKSTLSWTLANSVSSSCHVVTRRSTNPEKSLTSGKHPAPTTFSASASVLMAPPS